MYSDTLSPRDRAGPVTGVILVHLALGAMLLGLSGHLAPVAVQQTLKLFNVHDAPPPPPPPAPRPKPRLKPEAVKSASGAAPDRKSEATPVVAPEPQLIIPAASPVIAAPVPQQATAPDQGAGPVPGDGNGAGGVGSGSGGAGAGNGNGDDGDDGSDIHPRPMFRSLASRDYPRDLIQDLPRGARVFVLFTVQLDGRVTDCSVRQSSGDDALDTKVCEVAEQRFRYQPARHGDGTPFVAKAAYMQVF